MDPRYLVVFGACLTQFTVIGLMFTFGLFFAVFEEGFGWSRTVLSACTSLAFLVMGFVAIPAGALSDRYGPRIVLTFSGLMFATGYALISQVDAPWQLFVIFGLFLGIGMSTHDVVTLSTVARWFERRRGTMTGVTKVGTALGQMSLPPLAAALILALGWQQATLVLGIGAGVLALLAARSMKAPPKTEAERAGTPAPGISYGQARRTRIFWTLCIVQFLFFPTLMTVPLHIVVFGMDIGLSTMAAATILTVSQGASIVGRLTVGTLSDRLQTKHAYALCLMPLILSLGALQVIDAPWMLYGVMAIYGFGHGGLFTVSSPAVAKYFGMRAHGAIFGTVLFFGTIGGALGPTLAGWVFDVTGSYALAFGGLMAMAIAGLALVLSLPAERRL